MYGLLPFFSAVWLGAVLAISFMESWLKFRAKGMTRPVGMAVGRLVFTALNRCEWALFALCLAAAIVRPPQSSVTTILLFCIAAILLMQTGWLLPELKRRTIIVAEGGQPERSLIHQQFVALEVIKVLVLTLISLF